MVINTNNGLNPGNSAGTRSKVPEAEVSNRDPAPSGNSSSSGGADEVVLSSQAQAMSRLEASIATADSGNSDRVAAIKQALNEGTYTIDANSIAGNMLDQDDLLA